MKITSIDLTFHDIPFTPHANQHLQYWIPHWRITQICRIEFDNGITGIGETIQNYTYCRVPDDIEDRILGRKAAELMWDDELGAGVQIALFDGIAKHLEVPVYRLLGTKVRDSCPISWWTMDMPPEGWAEECRQAVEAGYTSTKFKARPWFDIHAAIQAVQKVVPPGFHLDLDYNGSLVNAANAVPHLKGLERYEEVAMIETPIPQVDVAGNRQIRSHINKPIAMHFGSPPVLTALKEEIVDGFVINRGASESLARAVICHEANKPLWLQLTGIGVTTAWAMHLGAVISPATWPAITCMNIYQDQMIHPRLEVRAGVIRVPEAPGLGIDLDQAQLDRTQVDYDFVDPPRHLLRYVRKSGEITWYGCGQQKLRGVYALEAQPISERGAYLEAVDDDGTKRFEELYDEAQKGPVRERVEESSKP